MNGALVWLNVGLLIATAGGASVAWWQAIAAGRARNDSESAKNAALETWKESTAALVRANQVSDVTLRGPYAYALLELGTALLSSRFVGEPEHMTMRLALDRTRAITEKGFLVGDSATHEITEWVTFYSRFGDIGEGQDFEKYGAANELVRDRIQLWFRDPEAAITLVAQDPRVDISR